MPPVSASLVVIELDSQFTTAHNTPHPFIYLRDRVQAIVSAVPASDLLLCVRGVTKATVDQALVVAQVAAQCRALLTLRGEVSALSTVTNLSASTLLAVLVDEFSDPKDVVNLGRQTCRINAATYLLSGNRPAAIFGSGCPCFVCDALETGDEPPFGPAAFIVDSEGYAVRPEAVSTMRSSKPIEELPLRSWLDSIGLEGGVPTIDFVHVAAARWPTPDGSERYVFWSYGGSMAFTHSLTQAAAAAAMGFDNERLYAEWLTAEGFNEVHAESYPTFPYEIPKRGVILEEDNVPRLRLPEIHENLILYVAVRIGQKETDAIRSAIGIGAADGPVAFALFGDTSPDPPLHRFNERSFPNLLDRAAEVLARATGAFIRSRAPLEKRMHAAKVLSLIPTPRSREIASALARNQNAEVSNCGKYALRRFRNSDCRKMSSEVKGNNNARLKWLEQAVVKLCAPSTPEEQT